MAAVASPIRWQVLYKDAEGKVVKEGPYSSTNPAVKEDPVGPNDSGPSSVLDIIIHVTIRDIVETKVIKTEAEAVEAGAESEKREVAVEDVAGGQKNHPYKISKVNSSVMVIRSQALIKALQAVVKYYPKQAITGDKITVDEPYFFVLHHMKDLEKYVDETEPMNATLNENTNGNVNGVIQGTAKDEASEKETNSLRHDFRVLKSYLDSKWGKKIERELERHRQNPPVATHEMLWMLFKPGTRVFAFPGEQLQTGGWIVRSIKWRTANNSYKLSLWNLDFNGEWITSKKSHFD